MANLNDLLNELENVVWEADCTSVQIAGALFDTPVVVGDRHISPSIESRLVEVLERLAKVRTRLSEIHASTGYKPREISSGEEQVMDLSQPVRRYPLSDDAA